MRSGASVQHRGTKMTQEEAVCVLVAGVSALLAGGWLCRPSGGTEVQAGEAVAYSFVDKNKCIT